MESVSLRAVQPHSVVKRGPAVSAGPVDSRVESRPSPLLRLQQQAFQLSTRGLVRLLDTPVPPLGPLGTMAAAIFRRVAPPDFVHGQPEPPQMAGALYMVGQDGTCTHLQDVPPQAVVNNREVMVVEGVGGEIPWYTGIIQKTFQSSEPGFVNVHQPVLGVHEGLGPNRLHDMARLFKNVAYLKQIEMSPATPEQVAAIYRNDPAVKTVHDQVRDALDRGRDLVLVPHSGGGAETALALHILTQEDGRYRPLIEKHLRILHIAAAAALEDYEQAGVPASNIYYTAIARDEVWQLAHVYVDPHDPGAGLSTVLPTVGGLLRSNFGGNSDAHSPDNIIRANAAPDGHQPVADFLAGGPGGVHVQNG